MQCTVDTVGVIVEYIYNKKFTMFKIRKKEKLGIRVRC